MLADGVARDLLGEPRRTRVPARDVGQPAAARRRSRSIASGRRSRRVSRDRHVQQIIAIAAFFFVASYTLSFIAVFVLRRREPTRRDRTARSGIRGRPASSSSDRSAFSSARSSPTGGTASIALGDRGRRAIRCSDLTRQSPRAGAFCRSRIFTRSATRAPEFIGART